MSGLLGALSGLGQGMAQTGNTLFNNELDKMKEARLIAIRQQERAEDRQFAVEDRNQMREWQLGDMDTQRGWQVEDRDFAAQHATQLAGMRSSSTRLDPMFNARLTAVNNDIKSIESLMELARDADELEELRSQHTALTNQRRSMLGMGGDDGMGGGTGNTFLDRLIAAGVTPDDPDAQTTDDTTESKLEVDPISVLRRFNESSAGQGLLNYQEKNAEYERNKQQLKSVRNALSRGWLPPAEQYEEVYHLLGPGEQRRLDQLRESQGQPRPSGIAQEMFPQLRN